MPLLTVDFIRRIRLPAYLIVAFLSLGSIVEVLISAWPPHVHDVNWRLSALNAAAGAAGTELLALLILITVAQISTSATGLWAGFWCSLAVGAGYLGVAATFALDALQLRARIPTEQLNRFDVTVAWALVRFGVTLLGCLFLAACAMAAARNRRREITRDTANRLVIGAAGLSQAGRAEA